MMSIDTSARSVSGAAVLAIVALLAACVAAGGETQARQILDASGVKGGLVLHVGCGDGMLTAALRVNDSYLVHGLDTDPANVQKARAHIRSRGLDGKVSVSRWTGSRLPFISNAVNLVVSEDLGKVPPAEVLRVLCPNGVAYVRKDGDWTKTVKPRPKDIDEWTHYLHDAGGNAVARDTRVGPPRHMQWLAAPTWTRNHHTLASISAVVSARGRIFYIVDEAPAASMELPGKWSLVARDAFNGVLLWQRAIPAWAWHRRKFRSGPVQLPRTLVAVGDRVYASLGIDAPVSALDAATGEIVRTYNGTKGTEEIVVHEGTVLVVTGSPMAEQAAIDPARRGKARYPNEKTIVAFGADAGKELWRVSEPGAGNPVPLTLAAEGKRAFFAVGKSVVCVDAGSGKELWRSPSAGAAKGAKAGKRKGGRQRRGGGARGAGWSVATLVVHDGVVLWANGGRLAALAAETGKPLWNCPCRPGFRSPTDVLVIDGLVWLGSDFWAGRDLHTGEVKKTNAVLKDLRTAGHHHRCYREKATARYILSGHRGIEFLDLVGDNHSRNNWIRGVCQYGVMPCNGLIYAPSHACGCYMEAKLYGFWAAAPRRSEAGPTPAPAEPRLERGPAYSQIGTPHSPLRTPHSEDWPTLRRDPLRSGSTALEIPTPLQAAWQTRVGGRLSAPVVADGSVVVSSIDAHRVVALDARDGKPRWAFTAGGRVDSPPTLHRGLALFGCADGWVYCLRLSDGELAWRFRAAPEDRQTVALDQVESVWPVSGSVLIQGGVAYVAAGRSSYLDGGIFLYGLDPTTGKVVCQSRVRTAHPKLGEGRDKSDAVRKKIVQNATDYKTFGAPDKSDAFSMGGATADVLVGDGSGVFMRHVKFDAKLARQEKKSRHLFSTSRLVDDAENHRSHWVLGTGDFSRIPVAYSWIAHKPGSYGSRLAVPYGLMLAFDGDTVWGIRRTRSYGYQLFADQNAPFAADEPSLPDFRRARPRNVPSFQWSVPFPMRPRAMLRAGSTLFLGGMPREIDARDPFAAYDGRKGGLLWAMSTKDGSKTAEQELEAPPVWDGMAAAGGRLYLCTVDGQVVCMGKGQ